MNFLDMSNEISIDFKAGYALINMSTVLAKHTNNGKVGGGQHLSFN